MNDEIDAKSIGYWFLGISVMLVIAGLVCGGLVLGLNWANRRFWNTPQSPLAPDQRIPPAPRLQADPTLEMNQLRERENAVLDAYSWIDRPEGVVRIPIDRAIELTAKESGR